MKKVLAVVLCIMSFTAAQEANIFSLGFWENATLEDVKRLSEQGTDWNSRDESRNTPTHTPLMFAVRASNNPEVILALLEAGADVNAKTDIGATPLLYASDFNDNPRIIEILIEAGADVNALSFDWTPLINAVASNKNPEIIRALINAGADVNAKTDEGSTPLIIATSISDANPEVVSLLLDAGANVYTRDTNYQTALDYAQRNPKINQTDVYYRLFESTMGFPHPSAQQSKNKTDGDFRGFVWGTQKESIKANEAATLSGDDDFYLSYEGSVGDYDAFIWFYFLSTGELARGAYGIKKVYNDSQDYLNDFTNIDAILTGLYGNPKSQEINWEDETFKNDASSWGLALASGDLSLYTIFSNGITEIQHRLYNQDNVISHVKYIFHMNSTINL